MTWLRRIGAVALTLAAIAGVLSVVLAVAVQAGTLRLLVVTSGSMTPTICQGDALVSHRVAASDLGVGDVVTVPQADGSLVTHRIIAVAPADDADPQARTLTLQGDANSIPDSATYTVSTAWVPAVRLPQGGAIVDTFRDPVVLVPAGIAMLALFALTFIPAAKHDDRAPAGPEAAPDEEPHTDEASQGT
ncbi:signal peptidase I [Xylanimonas allomyrinae]|uniref:Signal peptidase I n=1 Tax=Xylanimonas allomyrinae TaxID=2509459 RepID=A0A4P6ET99_9MICO|nr:signal peptidase I [Xylanimonas allomyrinae]QAY63577.1 signal peptidase I [Xylanimonas allomyrinae]